MTAATTSVNTRAHADAKHAENCNERFSKFHFDPQKC